MRRVRIIAAGLVVGLCLAGPALAQTANPGATQNVVPTSSAISEADRKALFARMIKDPGNLDLAFEYAAASAAAGDLEGAISTLERMLIFAPGLPRLQFELGVLYFRLGAFETAATYLRAVDAAPDTPPEIKAQIGLYLAAVEEKAKGTNFSGQVAAGVRYQTNANAGAANALVTINGLPFVLNAAAMSQPDTNVFGTVNLNASFDLPSQGDTLDVSFTGYAAGYQTLGSLNTVVAEAKAGPTYDLGRFKIDNARLALYGIAGGAFIGGAPYLGTLGAGSELTFILDARSSLKFRGEARYETFLDSPLRPTASFRTGQHYLGSATYRYQLNPGVSLYGTATLDRRIAQRGYLTNWTAVGEIGGIFGFASPIATLKDPWSFKLSGGVSALVADAPDPVFSTTAVEQTNQLFIDGALTIPLPNAFAVQTGVSYTQSLSNYGLSNFRNVAITIALSKGL